MKMWRVIHCDEQENFTDMAEAQKWINILIRNKARFSVTYIYAT